MDEPQNRTIRPPTLREFCDLAELEDEAKAMIRNDQGPGEFVQALVEAGHFADAVRFLAYALPRREAIWWAWSCARKVAGAEVPREHQAAFEVSERWIREPNEDNRRAAMPVAEAADLGTPAGCVALAIFLSGGSIAPPGLEAVEPEPATASQAIAGAVILSAVTTEPENAPEKYADFIDHGLKVADRIHLWRGN